MSLAVAIGGLAFLVLIHEAGHFVTALAVGMRPRKFYVFFPPALVRTVRGGVEYGIGTIPLGGYVKIPGIHRPAARDLDSALGQAIEEAPWLERSEAPVREALDREDYDAARAVLPELEAAVRRAQLSEAAAKRAGKSLTDLADALSGDAYWRAPAWKRIAVIVAGPVANVVFCVAMLAIVFSLGVIDGATRTVDEVVADSPAAAAGLRGGDEIVAVDGVAADSFEAISEAIRGSEGRPITVTVLRADEELTLGPVEAEEIDGRYRIGFVPVPSMRSYPPGEAITKAFEQTGEVTVAIGKALGGIVTGSSRGEVSSAVGIVDQSAEIVEAGFRYYLGVLALISLSLALLNLLPLLPLDGGHIAFSIAEKVRGRAIPREAYERASMIGIALVLLLFFIGLSNDIERLRAG